MRVYGKFQDCNLFPPVEQTQGRVEGKWVPSLATLGLRTCGENLILPKLVDVMLWCCDFEVNLYVLLCLCLLLCTVALLLYGAP